MKFRIKKHKKRLIFFLIVVVICGFWIYRQSIRNEPVNNITPSLNIPFDIFHPIASIKARDSEIAEWGAVINREPSALGKELALEDAFFSSCYNTGIQVASFIHSNTQTTCFSSYRSTCYHLTFWEEN
jgi:hypothetical protein